MTSNCKCERIREGERTKKGREKELKQEPKCKTSHLLPLSHAQDISGCSAQWEVQEPPDNIWTSPALFEVLLAWVSWQLGLERHLVGTKLGLSIFLPMFNNLAQPLLAWIKMQLSTFACRLMYSKE